MPCSNPSKRVLVSLRISGLYRVLWREIGAYTNAITRGAASVRPLRHHSKGRTSSGVDSSQLEGVALGITTVEEEFLAHIYLPDGRTVGEFMRPQIEESYSTGRMPPMLPMLPPGKTD